MKKIWEFICKCSSAFMSWLRDVLTKPLDASIFIAIILVVNSLLIKWNVINVVGSILILILLVIEFYNKKSLTK